MGMTQHQTYGAAGRLGLAEYLYCALAGASSFGWPSLPSGGKRIRSGAAAGSMPDSAGVARPAGCREPTNFGARL